MYVIRDLGIFWCDLRYLRNNGTNGINNFNKLTIIENKQILIELVIQNIRENVF